jgi:hypothetical protein
MLEGTDKQQRKNKQKNTHARKQQQKITKENSTGTKHKWKTHRV